MDNTGEVHFQEVDQEKLHGAISKSLDENFLAEVGSNSYQWQLS
jgi:hypothetical protein